MYNVQFVGLVCFFKDPGGGRQALLPDGRNPGGGIDEHFPRIVVKPEDVLGGEAWENDVASYDGNFPLPKCSIELDGAIQQGVSLDTSEHDGILPSLAAIAPGFRVDSSFAQTVAHASMKSGQLKAFRLPGTDDERPDVALVSQLTVNHDDDITIRITPRPNGTERTLRLKANAEVVIANVSNGSARFSANTPSHFTIYEKLSDNGATLTPPGNFVSIGVPRLDSDNPIFTELQPIGLAPDCSNTGCC